MSYVRFDIFCFYFSFSSKFIDDEKRIGNLRTFVLYYFNDKSNVYLHQLYYAAKKRRKIKQKLLSLSLKS